MYTKFLSESLYEKQPIFRRLCSIGLSEMYNNKSQTSEKAIIIILMKTNINKFINYIISNELLFDLQVKYYGPDTIIISNDSKTRCVVKGYEHGNFDISDFKETVTELLSNNIIVEETLFETPLFKDRDDITELYEFIKKYNISVMIYH